MSMNQPPIPPQPMQMPNLMQPTPLDPLETLSTLIATTASRPELNIDVQAKAIYELCHGYFFLASSKESMAQADVLHSQVQPNPEHQQMLNEADMANQHQIQQTESQHKMALNADQQNHQQALDRQNQSHQHELDLMKLKLEAERMQQQAQNPTQPTEK